MGAVFEDNRQLLPRIPVSVLGLEMRSLAAVAGRKLNTGFTAPTERTPSRASASDGHPFVATMIGGGLEGCGPSQPLPAVN
jgi:hypothetical protein